MTDKQPVLISGSSHLALAKACAHHLGAPLHRTHLETFASGEVYVSVDESVRQRDVFVLQSHSPPVNDHLIESLLLVDALKRSSARSVTLVSPFFPYARQDRRGTAREPISARVVASMLEAAGVDRVLTLDLHAPQIQGFFTRPLEHLSGIGVLSDYVRASQDLSNVSVVSPDAGRVKLAEAWSDRLGAPLAIIHKRRDEGVARTFEVVGDVSGRVCVIVDDMIDTAGTVVSAAATLKEKGAKEVVVAATHGVFSPPASARLEDGAVDGIIVSDSLPSAEDAGKGNSLITTLSVAPLLAEAIDAMVSGASLASFGGGHL